MINLKYIINLISFSYLNSSIEVVIPPIFKFQRQD